MGMLLTYILFYTKGERYVWHRPVDPWTEERAAKEYQYFGAGHGRRYKKVPLHAPGVRNGETGQLWRGMKPPPGKHWQYPPRILDEMDARGEIYWSPTGNPRRKIYLDQSEGVPVQDIWLEFRDAHNQNIAVSGYPTEKNPHLLARIIEASSQMPATCPGLLFRFRHDVERGFPASGAAGSGWTTAVRRSAQPSVVSAKGLEPMGDFVSRAELFRARRGGGGQSAAFGPDQIERPLTEQGRPASYH